MNLLERPGLRRLPSVALVPSDGGYDILVNGEHVLTVEDELDAHHWTKHVVECVHSGVTKPAWIRESLPRLCEVATRGNLHSGSPAVS